MKYLQSIVELTKVNTSKVVKLIRENNIFWWRLNYASTYIKNISKLQPEQQKTTTSANCSGPID